MKHHLRQITLHPKQITLHLWQITLHLSHMKRHLSQITLHPRHMKCYLRQITLHLRHMKRDMWQMKLHLWHLRLRMKCLKFQTRHFQLQMRRFKAVFARTFRKITALPQHNQQNTENDAFPNHIDEIHQITLNGAVEARLQAVASDGLLAHHHFFAVNTGAVVSDPIM
ncbi:hypothetical protein JXA32_15820 [Candidatus Sumerlaeota bacterium]|nr:hypothetical protein [Candidatus Sumerlaeota bacterium]